MEIYKVPQSIFPQYIFPSDRQPTLPGKSTVTRGIAIIIAKNFARIDLNHPGPTPQIPPCILSPQVDSSPIRRLFCATRRMTMSTRLKSNALGRVGASLHSMMCLLAFDMRSPANSARTTAWMKLNS